MADRSAVIWTRWGGQPSKVADIIRVGGVDSAEVRLTYDGGAPVGVSVFHDPARLRDVTLPFPITEHQPLPPYLEALVPPRTGPLWAYVIHHDGKAGWGGTRSWTRIDTLLGGAKRPDSKTGHVSLDLKVLVTEVLAGADRDVLKAKTLNPVFCEWLMGFLIGWTDAA